MKKKLFFLIILKDLFEICFNLVRTSVFLSKHG